MDGPGADHSDSDSCGSWTLLEHSPVYVKDPSEHEHDKDLIDGDAGQHSERDDDTDGISIISDCDNDTSTPCMQLSHEDLNDSTDYTRVDHPTEQHNTPHLLDDFITTNMPKETKESTKDTADYLGDSTGKQRTYVHRRNQRLSTVLNIIVLGSVITAAGVAIGHMWGVKDDCVIHSAPSVNKILSNLYKLQEENAYLRMKIKELTMLHNAYTQKDTKTLRHPKQQRCKKVFEESLTSENVDKLTKCVEFDDPLTESDVDQLLMQPQFEKDFLSDIDKLKHVYQQNKSWLDEEISKRQKSEKHSIKRIKAQLKFSNKDKAQNQDIVLLSSVNNNQSNINSVKLQENNDTFVQNKVSYADSLKSDTNSSAKRLKRETYSDYIPYNNEQRKRRKLKHDRDSLLEYSLVDDDIRKDDRYSDMKYKRDKKGNNHHNKYLNKKQKRRNKYEQWEMKGGYMKDYDDISVTSQDNNGFILIDKEFKPHNIELINYTEQLTGSRKKASRGDKNVEDFKKDKGDKEVKGDWYDRRAAERSAARRRLELELFERSATAPATAHWYLRRMRRRDSFRTDDSSPSPGNNTQRKNTRRQKNYKTKH